MKNIIFLLFIIKSSFVFTQSINKLKNEFWEAVNESSDKLIAKKKPSKIAIKFINTTLTMYSNLIMYELFYKNKYR